MIHDEISKQHLHLDQLQRAIFPKDSTVSVGINSLLVTFSNQEFAMSSFEGKDLSSSKSNSKLLPRSSVFSISGYLSIWFRNQVTTMVTLESVVSVSCTFSFEAFPRSSSTSVANSSVVLFSTNEFVVSIREEIDVGHCN